MNALDRLAAQLGDAATGTPVAARQMVLAAAEAVKGSIEGQIARDVPRRLVAGGKVGVKQRLLARSPSNPAVQLTEQGPLHLESNPTSGHEIVPKAKTGKRALRTPYGPKARVSHPGTRGKQTWQKGVEEARPLVGRAAAGAFAAHLFGIFR